MYVWGTKRSKQLSSGYINLLSVHDTQGVMELSASDFVSFLTNELDEENYSKLVINSRFHHILTNMLDRIGDAENNTHLTYDVVDKSYLSFLTFYNKWIGGNVESVEDSLARLDDLFQRVDKYTVARLPYMSDQEIHEFDRQVKRTIKSMADKHRRHTLSETMLKHTLDVSQSQLQLSDKKLREIVFNGWIERHYQEVDAEDDKRIIVFSSINDDVEKALWAYAEKKRIDSLWVSVKSPEPSEISPVIGFIFEFLNNVTERIINRNYSSGKYDDIQMVENDIFQHLWQAIDKNSSTWMVPSSTFEMIHLLM